MKNKNTAKQVANINFIVCLMFVSFVFLKMYTEIMCLDGEQDLKESPFSD